MKLGELRKIIADIDTVYDNCDVTCYESNGYYNGKIQVRVNIPKKDGTRSNREYLIYSWEVDSIKKID